MLLYKISEKDAIDFERFFELGQMLSREAENKKQDIEDMEYGTYLSLNI